MTDLHMARAETLSCAGTRYQAAIDELIVARGTTSDKLTLARIEARITQLERGPRRIWTASRAESGAVDGRRGCSFGASRLVLQAKIGAFHRFQRILMMKK